MRLQRAARRAEAVEFPFDGAGGVLTAYTRTGRQVDAGGAPAPLGPGTPDRDGDASAELAEELRRSREQLVFRREAQGHASRHARRRGPTLANVALQSETARRLVLHAPSTTERALQVLDGIARDAQATSQALRDLSYELRRPPSTTAGWSPRSRTWG